MKKSILIMLIMTCILSGCSCDGKTVISDTKETEFFKIISYVGNGVIVYDTRTNVEYWMSASSYNTGSLTLLVDEDGKPLIYKDGE